MSNSPQTPVETALSAISVAQYFVYKAQDCQDLLTNMKLQKLLYYAYAWYLVDTGERLFCERLKAWRHGPVVPEAYQIYKDCGSAPILTPQPRPELSTEVAGFLDGIWDDFGVESALRLMRMSHSEAPWINAWAKASDDNPSPAISDEDMIEYFTALASG
jgi:uncharacterized phage-associated protein